jgi:hypothetical protein
MLNRSSMEHSRDPMRDRALDHSASADTPEQETAEGKNTRKPPAFAVAATPPPDDPGGPRDKDGKPVRLPVQEHPSTPADATHARVHGPTEIHPLVETQGVTITADNVAPADRKAWKYLGQEHNSYYYFCEWKGKCYFIASTSVNSGEDIYHYYEPEGKAEWLLFYPDMPPDFMGDLQRTVALHYDILEWAKFLVIETAMMLLLEEVSLARYAGRVGVALWRGSRAVGRRAGRLVGKQAGKKAGKKAAEQTGAEAGETATEQAAKTVAAKEMRSATASNFRHNLQVLTKDEGVGMDAHHVFPQKFKLEFDNAGINLHEPRYGAWWERTNHQANAFAYNEIWKKFFKSERTKSEILDKGKEIMSTFGIPMNY